MFNRVSYKKAAKQELKGNWKVPVLVTLVYTLIIGIISLVGQNKNEAVTFASSLYSILTILISGMMEMAFICYFFNFISTKSETKFEYFISSLNRWKDGILGTLWFSLWVFLWSLLFLIPGIVKAYSYKFTLYILAENPGISVRQAMNISKELTKGHKADLFVLDLSFIGWGFLCLLTLGIGFLWLTPYMYTATIHAYQDIKQSALDSGKITEQDFSI